jgi:hypothetical protein
MYYYWPCKSQASWVGALIFYISCYLKAASSFLTALKRQVSYNITRTHAHVLSCCVRQQGVITIMVEWKMMRIFNFS